MTNETTAVDQPDIPPVQDAMGTARAPRPAITLERCRDPGFTPGARDVGPLIELWTRTSGDSKAARVVIKALARGDRGVAKALARDWAQADATQRVVRLRALSRIAGRLPVPELLPLLPVALEDREPRVVREAARAVGKLSDPQTGSTTSNHEPALLALVDHAQRPEQRAAIGALGRVGGPSALEHLQALQTDDADLARRRGEAITLITRRLQRAQSSEVQLDRPLPGPMEVWLRCRPGAAATVAAQARARLISKPSHVARLRIDVRTPTAVALQWSRSLDPLYRVRSATEVALVFALPRGPSAVERIVAGLRQPALEASLIAWTDGTPRFRLTLSAKGRRRSVVWEVARRLREQGSPLHNDSREVGWTIEVDLPNEQLRCIPRRDPRFDYRLRDVPAATHPTFAALLAWAGAPRPGDVVWDPFCGSGTELVEAARLEPDLELWGSDISATAIEAATTNLDAAGLDLARVHLRHDSALSVRPRDDDGQVSLILSNPPMGRRAVVEDRGLRSLLDDFVAHAARVLRPGGRMVWLSPAPRTTAHAGQRRGLSVEDLEAIDMGGFFSTPQVLRKPKTA